MQGAEKFPLHKKGTAARKVNSCSSPFFYYSYVRAMPSTLSTTPVI